MGDCWGTTIYSTWFPFNTSWSPSVERKNHAEINRMFTRVYANKRCRFDGQVEALFTWRGSNDKNQTKMCRVGDSSFLPGGECDKTLSQVWLTRCFHKKCAPTTHQRAPFPHQAQHQWLQRALGNNCGRVLSRNRNLGKLIVCIFWWEGIDPRVKKEPRSVANPIPTINRKQLVALNGSTKLYTGW